MLWRRKGYEGVQYPLHCEAWECPSKGFSCRNIQDHGVPIQEFGKARLWVEGSKSAFRGPKPPKFMKMNAEQEQLARFLQRLRKGLVRCHED